MQNKKTKDYLVTIGIILLCIFLIRDKFAAQSSDLTPKALEAVGKLGFSDSENQKAVIVFATSWCGVCRTLEKELTKAGTSFNSIDIEKDFNAAVAYEKVIGARSGPVPVSVVGNKYFVGNQSKAIAEFALKTPLAIK